MSGLTFDAPRDIAEIIDRVCDDDAKWFAEHPRARRRVRQHIPGEGWPFFAGPEWVTTVVTWVREGVRAREHFRQGQQIVSSVEAGRR